MNFYRVDLQESRAMSMIVYAKSSVAAVAALLKPKATLASKEEINKCVQGQYPYLTVEKVEEAK